MQAPPVNIKQGSPIRIVPHAKRKEKSPQISQGIKRIRQRKVSDSVEETLYNHGEGKT